MRGVCRCAQQPLLEGRIRVGRGAPKTGQTPDDAQLVADAQVVQPPKAARQVQGGGERVRLKAAEAPVGRHEIQTRLRLQQMCDTDVTAEMGKVGAAAHADVLAGVHQLTTTGVGERSRTPAQPAARLQQNDLETAARKAVAAARPARPPPIITTRSAMRSCPSQPDRHGLHNQAELPPTAQANPAAKDVVSALLDGVQQAAVGAQHDLEHGPARRRQQCR